MFILLMVVALILAGVYGWYATADENIENIQDLSIPCNRQLNFNPEGNELEWLDAVLLYENDYADLRTKHGWTIIKGWGFRRDADRFRPVRFQVGDVVVEGRYLEVDGMHVGIVEEKIIKK